MDFAAKMICRTKASPRVSFFAWQASKDRILTIDNLIKRGIVLTKKCFLCKNNAESSNHLLFWCPITYNLRTMVYGLLGICWVMVGSVKDELFAREIVCKKNKNFILILLTIFWVIWKKKQWSF